VGRRQRASSTAVVTHGPAGASLRHPPSQRPCDPSSKKCPAASGSPASTEAARVIQSWLDATACPVRPQAASAAMQHFCCITPRAIEGENSP
jgi:hypothetical protein